MKRTRMNQQGAVAMLSVVIFSIVISIVAAAYARTIVVQQREALNFDLSTRAYYAAESGVQDAIRKIRADSGLLESNKEECQPIGGGQIGDSDDIGYTCQLIEVETDEVSGATRQGDAALWKLPSTSGNLRVTLKWSEDPSETENFVARAEPSKLLPQAGNWVDKDGNSYHPMMRTSFISLPNVNITRDSIKQWVYFLNPTAEGDGELSSINLNNKQGEASVIHNATCEEAENGLECTQSFVVNGSYLSASKQGYIALQSVYGGDTKYTITASNASTDEPVSFAGVVSIDVTGRAGSVFRRVKQQVAVDGEQRVFISAPNANALVVGDGICKFFTVGNTPAQYQTQCRN